MMNGKKRDTLDDFSVNPIFLNYTEKCKILEGTYKNEYVESKLLQPRWTLFLGAFIFLIFVWLDRILIPKEVLMFFWIRVSVVGFLIALLIYVVYTFKYIKYTQIMMVVLCMIIAFSIIMMHASSKQSGHSFYLYALMIFLLYTFFFLKFQFKYSIIFSTSVMVMFNAIEFFFNRMPIGVYVDANLMIIFLLCSGTASAYMSEKSDRYKYCLMYQLEKEKYLVSKLNENLEKKVDFRDCQLKKTNEQLWLKENALRHLFENASDAIMILEDMLIVDCNRALLKLLRDHHKNQVLGKDFREFIDQYMMYPKPAWEKAWETLETDAIVTIKGKLLGQDYHKKIVEVTLNKVKYEDSTMVQCLLRDITKNEEMVHNLEYISYHDQLTGLYNRRYLKTIVIECENQQDLPIGLVIVDVNGLKSINDAFGHQIGDQYLIGVAEILKQSFTKKATILRLGGDEFLIVCRNTSEDEIKSFIHRANKIAEKYLVQNIRLSISTGFAMRYDMNVSIELLLKKAEDQMYQKKMLESPSLRRRTIDIILNTLHEKNNREEEHSHRVSRLARILGTAIELEEDKIKELEATGLLHDIGKIAIDESILNKAGALTEEEYAFVKKHSDIGYTILSTAPEMMEIAKYVLYHHERWDGKGYPAGIKGEDIPIQSRVITIVDAFDAMTSERTYRKAMETERAIEELIKHAGTQFDPQLVEMFVHLLK